MSSPDGPPSSAASPRPSETRDGSGPEAASARSYVLLASLIAGYIGVYLCRKNFSVAIPLLEAEWGLSRSQIGAVASWSTVAYAVGKFLFGPVIDRFGGRACFLVSLLGVAVFGSAAAFAPSLVILGVSYSANRFAGSAAWGSMVKLVPDWFGDRQLPLAMALLSLSFVFGGACATLLAGQVAEWSHNNWRWVMAGPVLALLAVFAWNWAVLPGRRQAGDGGVAGPPQAKSAGGSGLRLDQVPKLFTIPQFWAVCGLSFTLTLMRETFNTWTVDFFQTEGTHELSSRIAAFLATPFDLLGALGIVGLGWLFGRISRPVRARLLFVMLLVLTVLILNLPALFHLSLWLVTAAVGLIGFLSYGPYSLLAGIFSVEIRGREYVATVAGFVDGTGYLAGFLAGGYFGRIVDVGGYERGFQCLAGVTFVAAILSLFVYAGQPRR